MQKQAQKEPKKLQLKEEKKVDTSIASIILGERTALETKKEDEAKEAAQTTKSQAIVSSVDTSIASIILGDRTASKKMKEDKTIKSMPTKSIQAVISSHNSSYTEQVPANDTHPKGTASAPSSPNSRDPDLSSVVEAERLSGAVGFCDEDTVEDQEQSPDNGNGRNACHDNQEEQAAQQNRSMQSFGVEAVDDKNAFHVNNQDEQASQQNRSQQSLGVTRDETNDLDEYNRELQGVPMNQGIKGLSLEAKDDMGVIRDDNQENQQAQSDQGTECLGQETGDPEKDENVSRSEFVHLSDITAQENNENIPKTMQSESPTHLTLTNEGVPESTKILIATPGKQHVREPRDVNVPSVVKLVDTIEMSAMKSMSPNERHIGEATPAISVEGLAIKLQDEPGSQCNENCSKIVRRSRRLSIKHGGVFSPVARSENDKEETAPDGSNRNELSKNDKSAGGSKDAKRDEKKPNHSTTPMRRSKRRKSCPPNDTIEEIDTLDPDGNDRLRPSRKCKSGPSDEKKYDVGTAVLKKFRAGWFEGKVVSYDHQSKFYKIEYEDGDEEEVEEKELTKILKLNIVGPENTPSHYSKASISPGSGRDEIVNSPNCGQSTTSEVEKHPLRKSTRVESSFGGTEQAPNVESMEDDIFNATPSSSIASEISKPTLLALKPIWNASNSSKVTKECCEDDIFDETPSKELFGNRPSKHKSKRNSTSGIETRKEPSRSLRRKRQAPKRFGVYEYDPEEITATSLASKRKSLLKTAASKKSSRKRAKRVRISSEHLKEKRVKHSVVDDDNSIWRPSELQTLFSAHKSVNPKSYSFWEDVSELVVSKTAEECREKWFSLAQTPAAKAAPAKGKQATKRSLSDIAFDDDIFNATPMRGVLDDSSCQDGKPSGQALNQLHQTNGKIDDEGIKTSRVGGAEPSVIKGTVHADIQPKGYKMYIQKMGQCVRRKDPKSRKGRKNEAKLNKHFSEWDGEGDVEVNGRLSPGGTLRLKTHGDEDANDFLNYYDCDDEDGMDEETM